jgi:hypothetical protein
VFVSCRMQCDLECTPAMTYKQEVCTGCRWHDGCACNQHNSDPLDVCILSPLVPPLTVLSMLPCPPQPAGPRTGSVADRAASQQLDNVRRGVGAVSAGAAFNCAAAWLGADTHCLRHAKSPYLVLHAVSDVRFTCANTSELWAVSINAHSALNAMEAQCQCQHDMRCCCCDAAMMIQ